MGGDEFVVLIDGGPLDGSPELAAERLLDVIRPPFEINGVRPLPSRPASASRSLASSAGDLLRDADVALYEAKAAGKNRYADVPSARCTAVSRIASALEFDLHFAFERTSSGCSHQPIFDLNDRSHRR